MCEHANISATNHAIYCMDCGADVTVIDPMGYVDHRYYDSTAPYKNSLPSRRHVILSDEFSQISER